MKVSDFINLIEQKRYDKISHKALDWIASGFRNLEKLDELNKRIIKGLQKCNQNQKEYIEELENKIEKQV